MGDVCLTVRAAGEAETQTPVGVLFRVSPLHLALSWARRRDMKRALQLPLEKTWLS